MKNIELLNKYLWKNDLLIEGDDCIIRLNVVSDMVMQVDVYKKFHKIYSTRCYGDKNVKYIINKFGCNKINIVIDEKEGK